MTGVGVTDTDVVVIGAGPVGEMLLALLGHRGVRAVGFEKEAGIWPKPRAVHVDADILRAFQAVGLADRIAAGCEPMRSYRFENEAGEVLLDFPTERPNPNGWPESSMFHQPDVDALLRAEIEQLPTASLHSGHTVEEVDQDDERVTCQVTAPDGSTHAVTARYVVACDGASSRTRAAIGSAYTVLGPDDPWLVVDGGMPGEPPVEGSMVLLGHHSRPKIWARMPGRRGRMEFKIMPGDDLDEIVTPEAVERISGGLLRPDNFPIVRTAVYVFRSCLADRWRNGRVFLAGDAAHLTPPLFGQGLCSGIRDVVNLAWKLDHVLAGAPDSLLETYESERRAHVRTWIENATRMSQVLQTTDPAVAAQRDAHMRADPGAGAPTAPLLGPGLHGDTAPPAGEPAVQPVLPDGTRLDDAVGPRFLVAGPSALLAALPDDVRAGLAGTDRVVVRTEHDLGGAAVPPGGPAVVVRPDRYLLGVAATSEALAALCRTALAACTPTVLTTT